MPVAGFDHQGLLNLFWAEPRRDLEAPPGIRQPLSVERVFHAVFRGEDNELWLDGKRIVWSVANPIFAARETIIWRGARESSANAAPDGTLHLAFPSLDRGIVHLRQRNSPDPAERSRHVTEFYGDHGLHVDLARGRHGPAPAGDDAGQQPGRDRHNDGAEPVAVLPRQQRTAAELVRGRVTERQRGARMRVLVGRDAGEHGEQYRERPQCGLRIVNERVGNDACGLGRYSAAAPAARPRLVAFQRHDLHP